MSDKQIEVNIKKALKVAGYNTITDILELRQRTAKSSKSAHSLQGKRLNKLFINSKGSPETFKNIMFEQEKNINTIETAISISTVVVNLFILIYNVFI